MNRSCIIVIAFLLQCFLSSGQEILPDAITENTRLIINNSPYSTGQNLVINEGVTLVIEAGVHLLMQEGALISNSGRLLIEGTENKPVLFSSAEETGKWDYIHNTGSVFAKDLHILNGTRFITSFGDTVVVNHCTVTNTYGTVGDDCIGVHDAKKVLIKNSILEGNPESGKTDGLDLDGIVDDTIYGNIIRNFSDDGIDIGLSSENIVIFDNVISNCEMAVSIGENSTAKVYKNLLFRNLAGIQSHEGSLVTAQHNTLYGNIQGIRAYHSVSDETSGGTIYVSNSILAESTYDVVVKSSSTVGFEYCLTDSILLDGTGNLIGRADFIDTQEDNFRLKGSSAAIDAGNPDNDNDGQDFNSDLDDTDPDGTRLDLGCYSYFQSPLKIVVISPSNLFLFQNDSGDYSDWITIFNNSESNINLKQYYISDNQDNNLKYQITEDLFVLNGDSITFWADNSMYPSRHYLPFKLSGDGEYISLSDPDGVIIDEKIFGRVPIDYIYKRIGVTDDWEYSEWPISDTSETFTGLSVSPEFSNPGGETQFPLEVTLSAKNVLNSVYYSIDGSKPLSGSVYDDILTISEPLTLRAVTEQEDYIPSYAHAASYFLDSEYELPIISISTDEENLYDEVSGIYRWPWGSGPKWERPASISYYDGIKQFSSIGGIRIQGGNSVGMPKKSFRFHFRGGYGNSRLSATPFNHGPLSFKNLVIRSGYDDDITNSGGTMLRDPYSTELWKKLGELSTESAFGVLLLNNNYWGIYNIRESINEYFVEDHHRIRDFDLIRFQKWGADLKSGEWTAWNELVNYFDTTDFSRPEVYDEVSGFVDLNSTLNLLSLIHCTQFRSWTWGTFAIKPADGKWSWTIWDTDRSYEMITWNGFSEYANTSAEKWPNFIPQKLIKNERFKNDLINRNCDLMNSLLIPEHGISIYDSLVAIIEPEMDAEYERWNPGNLALWDTNNEKVRNFLQERPSHLYDQMKSYFLIEDTVLIDIQIIGNGEVKLNSLMIDEPNWEGVYMKGIPISLKAIPANGSNFIEWKDLSGEHSILINPGETNKIVAVFDTASNSEREKLVINEIMYNPDDPANSEWIEFYNPNNFSVSMEGFSILDGGIGNKFVFPSGAVIDPTDYLVLAGDWTDYIAQHGVDNVVTAGFNEGIDGFQLSNGGETIILKDSEDQLEDKVQYDDLYPWPVFADGFGPSMQLESPDLDNTTPENWFADLEIMYTPGKRNKGFTHVEEGNTDNSLIIYPNPVSEILHIDLPSDKYSSALLQIFSISGRKVAEKSFDSLSGSNKLSWEHDLSQDGLYVLKVILSTPNKVEMKSRIVIYQKK